MAIDPLRNDHTVLVSGDSISRGVVYNEARRRYGLLADGYVGLMSGLLKGAVHNAARFGHTLSRGLARLAGEVAEKKPDIVLLEFGGNDCDFNWPEVAGNPHADHRPRTDYERFRQLLAGAVLRLKDAGITPVLMTLPPIDAEKYLEFISGGAAAARENIMKWLGGVSRLYWQQERYNNAVAGVARETGAALIDVRDAFLRKTDFRDLLCADGIHPNAAGHRVIAEAIARHVGDRCPFLLKAPAGAS